MGRKRVLGVHRQVQAGAHRAQNLHLAAEQRSGAGEVNAAGVMEQKCCRGDSYTEKEAWRPTQSPGVSGRVQTCVCMTGNPPGLGRAAKKWTAHTTSGVPPSRAERQEHEGYPGESQRDN